MFHGFLQTAGDQEDLRAADSAGEKALCSTNVSLLCNFFLFPQLSQRSVSDCCLSPPGEASCH